MGKADIPKALEKMVKSQKRKGPATLHTSQLSAASWKHNLHNFVSSLLFGYFLSLQHLVGGLVVNERRMWLGDLKERSVSPWGTEIARGTTAACAASQRGEAAVRHFSWPATTVVTLTCAMPVQHFGCSELRKDSSRAQACCCKPHRQCGCYHCSSPSTTADPQRSSQHFSEEFER